MNAKEKIERGEGVEGHLYTLLAFLIINWYLGTCCMQGIALDPRRESGEL